MLWNEIFKWWSIVLSAAKKLPCVILIFKKKENVRAVARQEALNKKGE